MNDSVLIKLFFIASSDCNVVLSRTKLMAFLRYSCSSFAVVRIRANNNNTDSSFELVLCHFHFVLVSCIFCQVSGPERSEFRIPEAPTERVSEWNHRQLPDSLKPLRLLYVVLVSNSCSFYVVAV